MKLMYLVMVVFIVVSFGIDYLSVLSTRMILRGVLELVSLCVLAPHVYRSMRRETVDHLWAAWRTIHQHDCDIHEQLPPVRPRSESEKLSR